MRFWSCILGQNRGVFMGLWSFLWLDEVFWKRFLFSLAEWGVLKTFLQILYCYEESLVVRVYFKSFMQILCFFKESLIVRLNLMLFMYFWNRLNLNWICPCIPYFIPGLDWKCFHVSCIVLRQDWIVLIILNIESSLLELFGAFLCWHGKSGVTLQSGGALE